MNPTNSVRRVLCVVVGLALLSVPVAAEELAASEGGHEASCEALTDEAFAAIDELDTMLPVDPIYEAEVIGRLQRITTQLNHDLSGLGC